MSFEVSLIRLFYIFSFRGVIPDICIVTDLYSVCLQTSNLDILLSFTISILFSSYENNCRKTKVYK